MTEFGVSLESWDNIFKIFSNHTFIEEAILYGSRAKGNFRLGSDIDITLKGSNISLKDVNSLSTELDDLLLPYIFDFTIYEKIKSKDLIDHINRVGVTIYKKNT